MGKESTIPLLVIGLVVAFSAGFLVGERSSPPPQQVEAMPLPANWDPSASALKVAQENSKACYDLLQKFVIARGEEDGKRATH